ncbi:translation initiation factor IF-2, partial [Weeksellaceae bacterium TAE3-ERU29]|nr:translation initiation factor IF-2 [Weeksellaceae bacterium TAE3-ERU29]
KEAIPATPVTILGLDGAPAAGDKFRVFVDEKEAKQLAGKREQLHREQTIRTQKHITLDEIGRRIALGDFQELNIVLKGDVDGSVEALTDSLQKLSTNEIHVNILHKGVGQITESDVLLASASDAIVIGFNVRPNVSARNIADKEEVEIRTYSIIYDAINELKEAMEGMLSPELKEEVIGNVEIRETFKISKVGTIAGCMVLDGKITRTSSVRIIRDGVVVHEGELASLKRYKDDVKEVTKGYECGLNIKNYNDIKVGDVIEVYVVNEVKKRLK